MKSKITSLDNLLPIISGRRQAGKYSVVFTNGCFDLLHVGHVRYLQQARALGDCLIVGINSDRSVHSLEKGIGRPVIPGEQRGEVLSALECVNFVVTFDEPDPLLLIQAIRPDVLVKGGDWSLDRIIGREVVEAGGGRVLSIPLVADISTTAIIERIQSKVPPSGRQDEPPSNPGSSETSRTIL